MRSPRTSLPAALVVAALAAGGCGDDPLPRVRVLQVDTTVFASQPGAAAKPRAATPVRAALTAAAGPVAPPPIQVPDVGSVAIGATNHGSLLNGLQLPETGPDWITWDPGTHSSPSRPDRRWATDRLLAFLIGVLREYRLANPSAPPVLIGDLSRPGGGPFGSDYGGLGHASHQNGLDADVMYPRTDGALLPPDGVQSVDRRLARDLVNRFVAAGAQFTFVGLHVGLGGPPNVVQAIANHDDHVHVRIPNVSH